MGDGLEALPIIYLLVVYFTSLKFDMNIFLVFCGVAIVFAVIDVFKTAVKRKQVKK